MHKERLRYDENHWLRSKDPEQVIHSSIEQQSKAYSRVKTRHIFELLGNLKDARVLDYGCGSGFFTIRCAKAGAANVVGIDAEIHALAAAEHFATQEGVKDNCSFICSDRFPTSWCQEPFDAILFKDVLEHVEDEQSLLQSAARMLVPGGAMVISTQNKLSLNFALEGFYHRILRNDKNWFGWDPTHLRFFTPRILERELKTAGLKCVAWRSSYILPYKFPPLPFSKKRFFRIDSLSHLDTILGKRFPFSKCGWNIIVKAIKV
jgi:2-polyprenyl-6-hydroxyphenyl methylase / 3-demethylubiquinone-9 3-methyltransferase